MPIGRHERSVWQTIAALKDYVYKSTHAEVLNQHRDWLESFTGT
jgi:hypothetical protein